MTSTLFLVALAARAAERAEPERFGGGDPPPMDAQLFHPAIGSERLLWTEEVGTREDPTFHTGLLFHYANDPLIWTGPGGETVGVVTDVMQMDAMLEGKLGPVRLGMDLPVHLYSRGQAATGSSLGDFGLDGKLILVDHDHAPFGIPLAARVLLPTATTALPLASEAPEVEAQLGVDQEFGRVLFAGNAGWMDGPDLLVGDEHFDDFVFARLGVSVAVGPQSGLSLETGARAALTEALTSDTTAAEWLASTYVGLGGGAQLRLGGGTGLGSGVGSPDFRAMAGFSFGPETAHAETRAVPEIAAAEAVPAEENCPLEGPPPGMDVELLFVDEAHQPLATATTRVEGIADRCGHGVQAAHEVVLKDEARSGPVGFQQTYDVSGTKVALDLVLSPGAVDKVKLTKDRIELAEEVRFGTASATILADSYPLLDQVASVLSAHPEIERLRIEGHSDDRGPDDYNLTLSKARAAAVREYLVHHGVAANRLRSEGYGEMVPADAAVGEIAWAKNRRVDLYVEEWAN